MSDSVAETARRVTTGQFTPISDQPIRPSRRLQAIIERTMNLDPNHRYRDMRALGQDLLQLAGQRTRITWGLTFGDVASAVRPHHAKELDEEPLALARTRAPRGGRASLWPIIAAACVGVASVTAFTWSTKRQPAPSAESPLVTATVPQVASQRLQIIPAPSSTQFSLPAPVFAAPEARAVVPSPATLTPPPKVAHAAAHVPSPAPLPAHDAVNAREAADEDVEVEQSEDVAEPVDDGEARNREVRARQQRQRQRVEPRVEPPAPAAEPPPPEGPDWIVERRRQKAHSTPTRFQTGTNAAPIFD